MIAVGSDHASLELKREILAYLEEAGIPYKDFGMNSPNEPGCYADVAEVACGAVARGECGKAILLCGTGIGISMAANKVRGIRAAACSDYFSAKYTRLHNDANALCLGARVVGPGLARELVEVFLHTEFEGGRHAPRVERIMEIEAKSAAGA